MSNAAPAKVEPEKTKLLQEFKHSRPLTTCLWEPKSRFVFFGAEDNLIHRYDLKTKKVVALTGHNSWVRGLACSKDGEVLYSAGYDGQLGFWPVAADQPKSQRMIQAHQGWVRAVLVSPDGKQLATCGNDNLVKLWNAADGKLVKQFAGHQSHVYNVIFSQNGSMLYSCDLKGAVKSWEIASGKSQDLLTVKALHHYDTTFRADIGGARSIGLSRDGKQLALGGITKVTNAFAGVGEVAVAVVNLADGKLKVLLESKDKVKGAAWGVAHHPQGFWMGLTGGNGGGWFFFWKEGSNHEFFKMKLKYDGRGMSVSPDFQQVAVAHADNHLRVYKLGA